MAIKAQSLQVSQIERGRVVPEKETGWKLVRWDNKERERKAFEGASSKLRRIPSEGSYKDEQLNG